MTIFIWAMILVVGVIYTALASLQLMRVADKQPALVNSEDFWLPQLIFGLILSMTFGLVLTLFEGKPFVFCMLFGFAVALATGIPVWAWFQFEMRSRIESVFRAVVARAKAEQEKWKSRDSALANRAKKQAKLLTEIIPETEWMDFREEIARIAGEYVPALLADSAQLEREIGDVGRIIGEYSDRELDDFGRELLDKTMDDKTELEAALRKNREQVEACLIFLDHLRSDLYVARRREDAREDLAEKFRAMTNAVQQTSNQIAKARTEVDAIDARKVLRLKDHERS